MPVHPTIASLQLTLLLNNYYCKQSKEPPELKRLWRLKTESYESAKSHS